MCKAEREEHAWFGVFLWEKTRQKECKNLLIG